MSISIVAHLAVGQVAFGEMTRHPFSDAVVDLFYFERFGAVPFDRMSF